MGGSGGGPRGSRGERLLQRLVFGSLRSIRRLRVGPTLRERLRMGPPRTVGFKGSEFTAVVPRDAPVHVRPSQWSAGRKLLVMTARQARLRQVARIVKLWIAPAARHVAHLKAATIRVEQQAVPS